MRIATLTNIAYIATVCLTLSSGVSLFVASNAERAERAAVQQSRDFDALTEELEKEAFSLSNLARQAMVKEDDEVSQAWKAKLAQDRIMEAHLAALRDNGASQSELHILQTALMALDKLEEEQRTAVTAFETGKRDDGVRLLFSREYEANLAQVENAFTQFRSLLDQRTDTAIAEATQLSQRLRTLSEIMVGLTALLFLFVLGFIIRHRILRPVITLSDVVNRLATQDYAVQTPAISHVDEIGDMAQAISIFRENGLARQRLEQERDADWETRKLLARMTRRLQGCDSYSDIILATTVFAPHIIPNAGGQLYILDDHIDLMRCVAHWLLPEGGESSFAPEHCWALKRGHLHSPLRDAVDMPCAHVPAELSARAICVPLIAQNKIIGLLSFTNHTPESEPPYIYIELMAETLALALANQKLRESLTRKATFDALTGMRNRTDLDDTLHAAIEQAKASQSVLSCMMLDIDHFKKLNDTWGHEAGDKVLTEIAAIIAGCLKNSGTAFRYGGEEFLIILPDMNEAQTRALAEAILENVASHPMRYDAQLIGPVSVSIGLAVWPHHARSDNLVRAADLALYHAKENGRGQIRVARDAVVQDTAS
ncbi:diguanylate cyclase domain-containing protein [Siccibacter turicensis]|uniref:diguanylate cyclase domain-containing protein n=1 Tax=Siccibacter turicensis TaxID=357233 RepID=UPI0004640E82|nr:diguanylate cyclase [Siccibacter turicensis]